MWEFVEKIYSDVGTKMKNITKTIFFITMILTIIGVVIFEFAFMINAIDEEIGLAMYLLISALIPISAAIGLFGMWWSSLLIFSVGTIVENIEKPSQNKVSYVAEFKQNVPSNLNDSQSVQDKSNTKLAAILTPNIPQQKTETVWICKECRAKNGWGRTTCWSCDKPKN